MGRVWEHQIRFVSSILVVLLKIHGTSLNDESLKSFFVEAEAVVNTRPIQQNPYQIFILVPLFPMQLLINKGLLCHPQENFKKDI